MRENIPGHISEHFCNFKKMITSRGSEPELPLKMIPEVNRKIWGIKKHRLTVIGGRTSHGKSAFALQIAYDLSSQGHAVLFLSLEMATEDMMERLFCLSHKIDNYELLTGKYLKYEKDIEDFEKKIDDMNLVITDYIGKTWQDIDKYIVTLSKKPDIIIVDYIQTIAGSSMQKKESIDEYIRHFREMAIRNNFAAVICSQINRSSQETESKEPQLHQLKGTGYLEEHADVCLLLHWPYKYNENVDKNEYKLFVSKNRNGRTGYVKLRYFPEFYLFEDWEKVENHQEIAEEIEQWQE